MNQNMIDPAVPRLDPVDPATKNHSTRLLAMIREQTRNNNTSRNTNHYNGAPIHPLEGYPYSRGGVALTHGPSAHLFRMLQHQQNHRAVAFIPHNAYSIDPITGQMIPPLAEDLIPKGLTIDRVHPQMWQCIQQSSNYTEGVDEEACGLSGFDRVLYSCSEQARRIVCDEYTRLARDHTMDLAITIPVQVPYGTLICDIFSGEHYYGIQGDKASPNHPHSDRTLFGRGLAANHTQSYSIPNEDEGLQGIADPSYGAHPSACDVWSSFLKIKVGTIYNVKPEHMKIVTEALRNTFANVLFDGPINFTANGIFACGNEGILQSPSYPQSGGKVTFVTHLKPTTDRDVNMLISVRQRVKYFANALGFHFGGSLGGSAYGGNVHDHTPLISVELDANIRSDRIYTGLVQCAIRTYNDRVPKALKDQVWMPKGQFDSNGQPIYRNATKDVIRSQVEATEIRLEQERGYVIDPRWPKDLILTRRIAASDTPLQKDTQSPQRFGRHVFAKASAQKVTYVAKFSDQIPTESKDPEAIPGTLVQQKLLSTRFKREFSMYIRTEPLAGYPRAPAETMSPLEAPLPTKFFSQNHNKIANAGAEAARRPPAASWNVEAVEFKPSGFFALTQGNPKGGKYKKRYQSRSKAQDLVAAAQPTAAGR